MAKFCPNCGSQINEGVSFCSNCGTQVNNTQVAVQNNQQQPKANNGSWVLITAGSMLGVALLSCLGFFGDSTFASILKTFSFSLEVATLVILIVGLIKYPKNKGIKIFFWIYLAFVIITIILAIIFLALCIGAIGSLGSAAAEGCEDLSEMGTITSLIPMIF